MIALCSVFMLASYFQYLTISVSFFAGLFIMVLVIEIDKKWALISYIVSAFIAFLLAEPEAKLLFIVFFGYYPIIKSVFERLKNRVLEYALKFLCFNAAIVLAYTVFAGAFGVILGDMNEFGKYTAFILLIAANIIFPIYDVMLSRMAAFYMIKLHNKVIKLLKF